MNRRWLKQVLAMLFWLGLWWGMAVAVQRPILLPSPAAVFLRLTDFIGQPDFWVIVSSSIWHIMLGILCAVILGSILAVLTAQFPLLDLMLSPLLTTVKSTPVASFILLVLVWIGRDSVPSIISGLMVLPVVWSNIRTGIRNVDAQLIEMAALYRLRPYVMLRRLYFPSVMPYFLSALKISIGIGWKAGIAAEVLTVPANTIGKMIYESKLYLETTDLFAWTLVVVCISLFIEKIISAALGRLDIQHGRKVAASDD